jgi:hypothetical protein
MLLRRWRFRSVLSLQKKAGVYKILIKPTVVVDSGVRKRKLPHPAVGDLIPGFKPVDCRETFSKRATTYEV